MKSEIIGKGTWIDKVADILIKREKKLGRKIDVVRVESGLGASGIPHIGSMGDAVRAYGVALALQNFGYDAELIAYSDDLDGLRKIPQGLPQWLKENLGMPVSNIRDPFGSCHESYGAHMSGVLLDGLDKLGIKYTFQSATEVYKKGILTEEIDAILRKSSDVGRKIAHMVGQLKYKEVLPYFPICQNCGKLYVTRAEKYLADEKKILYTCSDTTIGNKGLKGCGYKGEAAISKGDGKLSWKVEFAARWRALDIRFEAYGKDIMESVEINDWIANEILGYAHPLHIKYEMFLDKRGKKISKSAGNVLTPQKWLRYGSAESILLLLFKRIQGTRHVGVDDIPNLMDEYDLYEDMYFGTIQEVNEAKLIKVKGVYEFIHHLKPPSKPCGHIPYRILIQQSSLFSGDPYQIEKVYNRLAKYGLIKGQKTDNNLLKKIRLASNWANDQFPIVEEFKIDMTDNQKKAVSELIQILTAFTNFEHDPQAAKILQTKVFDVARKYELEPKDLFTILYKMLINSDRGPRISNYILDLGIERTCNILRRYTVN
jgi:lysyl-tRNA synthetase class 1